MKFCVSAYPSHRSVSKGMNFFMSVSIAAIIAVQMMSGTVAKASINHTSQENNDIHFLQRVNQTKLINVNLGEKTFDINIASQSLPKALKQLHQQAGLNFAYSSEAIKHIQSNEVHGKMTAKLALSALLKGTQVNANIVGDGTAALKVAQAGDEIVLDGITVYGEKTERDLQDTRSSVQVFTAQDLEESTAQKLDDVLDQTANVNQRFGGEGFSIRGINNEGLGQTGLGSAPLATLYIDGSAISRFGVRTGIEDLWDVEQIEVFRGPQSTTQGRNTLAGSIIINTKAPTYNFESAARAGIGSQNSALFSGLVNIPIIDNILAVRISGDFKTTDGFYDNLTLNIDDQAFRESKSIRGKVLFEPNDKIKNILTLTYARNESGDDFVDRNSLFDRENFGNIRGGENTDQIISTLDSKITLNDQWSIHNIVSFNRTTYDRVNDTDGFFGGNNVVGALGQFARQNETDTFTEELRLHYNNSGFKGHIGAYFAKEKEDETSQAVTEFTNAEIQGFGVPASLIGFYEGLTVSQDRIETRDVQNIAGFGEFSYDFNKFFTLFGGLRYDRNEFETISSEDRFPVNPLPDPNVNCAIGGPAAIGGCTAVNAQLNSLLNQPDDPGSSTVSEAWLPSLGVTLNWQEEFSTSFFVKRGYRSGGSGTSFGTFTAFEFDPEFVWNYEFSVRSQWFDKKLTLNANLFYMDWQDQQVAVAASNIIGDRLISNAGKSNLKGFEVEAFAKPTDQLSLRGSVGYVKTEFEEFVSDFGDFSGNELPNAPKWTISGSARYSFYNGIYLQADANFRSRAFSEAGNDPSGFEDERTIVNAKIGYKTEKVDAFIFSNNLFDEDYVASAFENDPLVKIGDGRSIGVRVNMKLD